MDSRGVTPARQPELILASEADRRVSTAHSQRDTSSTLTANDRKSKTTLDQSDGFPNTKPFIQEPPGHLTMTPDNTPRHPEDLSNNVAQILTLLENEVSGGDGGEEQEESILEGDEMFMALTDEERQEWETMMKDRTNQLNMSKNQHQEWSDSFTRRRMFAYSRMRKLQECYKNRAQFFTDMTETLTTKIGKARARTSLTEHKKTTEKRLSEPQLRRSDSAHVQAVTEKHKPIRRNETMPEISEKSLATNDTGEMHCASRNIAGDTTVHTRPSGDSREVVNVKSLSSSQSSQNESSTLKSDENESTFLHLDRAQTPFVTVDQVNPNG